MKKVVFLVAAAGLVTSFAQGETSPFAVTRIQTQITAQTPKDIPFDMGPSGIVNGKAGYDFAYLIAGENIASIKKESLTITKLQMQDGTDLSKTFRGTPNYKLGPFPKTSDDGKYARFNVQVTSEQTSATEVPTLEGSIIVYVADGTETKSLTLKTDDAQTHTVGVYKVSLSKEMGFGVKIEGPEHDIAAVEVTADGQRLEKTGTSFFSSSSAGSRRETKETSKTYNFAKPSVAEITINLILWKNLKEHAVSF